MKIRDLLVILLYITLQNVYGKSIVKHGRKYASVDKSSKHHTNGQKTRTKTNDNLEKQSSEKVSLNYNTNNVKHKDSGKPSGKPYGDCTVNCTIIFENPGDDDVNLMEQEKEEEKEENSGEYSTPKRLEGSSKISNAVEPNESSGDDMVEVDKPVGTENSQNTNAHKGNESKIAPAVASPNLAPKEKNDAGRNKNKQVALTPQSSVQEGTKSAVSNMSDASKYPSLPIPQMIPLPLFYNSGENEGSAINPLASDTKNTTEMDEVNGESGYGELFLNNSQKGVRAPALVLSVKSPQGKPLSDVNNGSGQLRSGKRVHLHAGKKVNIDQPVPVPSGAAAVSSKFTPHVDNKLAAARPGGETTTDYPFVVSDGPKANIHPILNSKIKIGNDHDEDLVDYYDEDDDGDEPSTSPPSSQPLNRGADSEEENETESGESESVPTFDENGNLKQGQQQGEEEEDEDVSGSGSGNTAADYSGDTDSLSYAPIQEKQQMMKSINDRGNDAIFSDAVMNTPWLPGHYTETIYTNNTSPESTSETYMLPVSEDQCKILHDYAAANRDATNPSDMSINSDILAHLRTTNSSQGTRPLTNAEVLLASTNPGDISTFRRLLIKLASDCYSESVNKLSSEKKLVNGTLPGQDQDTAASDAVTKQTESEQQGNTQSQSDAILPVSRDTTEYNLEANLKKLIEGKKRNTFAETQKQDDSLEEKNTDASYTPIQNHAKGKQINIDFPDYRKMDLGSNKKVSDAVKVDEEEPKKKKKGGKVKTKTFEFGPGELGGNNLPIVVPVISKHPKEAEDAKKPAPAQDKPAPAQDERNKGNDSKDVKKSTKDKTKKGTSEHKLTAEQPERPSSSNMVPPQQKGEQPELPTNNNNVPNVPPQQKGEKPNAASNNNSVPPPQKDIAKGLSKEQLKEKWIVQDVKVNKDISLILDQFSGNQPKYTATAGAPQALPQPDIKTNVGSPQLLSKPPEAYAQAVNRDVPVPSAMMQPLAQTAANKKADSGASGFLQNGVGTRIMNEIVQITEPPTPLNRAPIVALQAPLRVPVTASQRNPCMGLCLTSCTPDCDPGCCRSGFSIGGGITAEILPIPEDLNKVIKAAGIGPGTTAQILPTPQNKKMLQQAGFGDGVTARIVPIPAGYSIVGTSPSIAASRSDPNPKNPLIPAKQNVAPQLANLNKETSQPPHPPAPSVGALVPPPNVQPPQVQQQPNKALPSPVQYAANSQPPRPAVGQQATSAPNSQQPQDPSARDQGITALTNLPNDKQAQNNQQAAKNDQPPAQQKTELIAKIETLPAGVKNYDEATYAEILSQLPASVAPEQPVLQPLPVTQQLSQLNVNDQVGRHPVNMFFSGRKRQDPYQNLEAYKRQEFKNYDERFLVDDR